MRQSGMSLREAAIEMLRELGPTHYRKLTDEILSRSLAKSSAEKPERAVNKIMSSDINNNGTESEFARVRPGVYCLRASHVEPEPGGKVVEELPDHGSQGATAGSEHARRVRIPSFPTYGQVRHLLKVWSGRPKMQVTGLHSALAQLRGTPQNPVDWTDPDFWIPKKLAGDAHDLAMAIGPRARKVSTQGTPVGTGVWSGNTTLARQRRTATSCSPTEVMISSRKKAVIPRSS